MEEKIVTVIEMYRDEENTLRQGIMYPYGDIRAAEFQRSKLNPHITKLIETRYLNKDGEVIFVELEREED